MARAYKIISADSHLEIDSKYWVHRVPEKYRERAPRLIRTETGGDAWVIEGAPAREAAPDLYGGKGRDKWRPYGQRYEDTPGTGPAEQRLREQDIDGVDAEVFYPCMQGGPNFWRNINDDTPYKAVVRAYNDWLAEEYCGVAPDRLFGLGVIPMTNIDDAVVELEHIKRIDLRGALLVAYPSNKGHPTAEDDRFWAASLDLEIPVTIHIELNRQGLRSGPIMPKRPGSVGHEITLAADYPFQLSRFSRVGGLNAVQMIMDGVFDRFRNLRVYFAETHCGWIPFFYYMADLRYKRHHKWAEELQRYQPLRMLPSEYMREHIYWGFLDDPIGVEMRHHVGSNRMMWGTDFPHQESNWPNSKEVIDQLMKGLPEDERHMMLAGNAVEFFRLEERGK